MTGVSLDCPQVLTDIYRQKGQITGDPSICKAALS